MSAPRWFRAVWIAAALAVVLGWGRDPFLSWLPRPRELPRADGAIGRPWISGEYVLGDVGGVDRGLLPPEIQHAGSGSHGDEWQGRAETAWFRVTRRWWIHVAVAGYPQHAGCKLWAEFQSADGTIRRLDCPIGNPQERWNIWEIRRPAGAIAVRFIAEDRATDHSGWLAFSHPFRAPPGVITATYHGVQVFTTIALAFTLLWGPGLLWVPRQATPVVRAAFLVGLGPLILAAVGIVVWCASGAIHPAGPALAAVGGLWLALGVTAWKRKFAVPLSPAFLRVFGVSALVVIAVAAKSSYSRGPEGELFHGAVSRNLTVGDRIDSRYPYYVVQVAARHLGPASPETEGFFYPWTFFSRGPLAGLATIPVVLATAGEPPDVMPDQRWSPYDGYGFTAYRLAMMTLSSGVILALFALSASLVGERWALIAAGLLALSPFGVHEVMFTWPKWAATTWVLIGFWFAHACRPGAAGLALAVGYFFHPMALLWAPWLAAWAGGRRALAPSSDRSRAGFSRLAFIIGGARFGIALLALVLPWMVIGARVPHLPDTPFAGQGGFLRYWLEADWHRATWDTWLQTRWQNFANTFLPLHVYFDGFDHPKFRSAYGESGRLVKFAFVWWNSLPFGLGLVVWGVALAALLRAWRFFRAATCLLVLAPAAMMVAYWGMDPLGLMRECGHPLFVAIIALTCLVASRTGGWLEAVLSSPAVPWLQLPETFLMLWLTTLANPQRPSVELSHLDSLYLVLNVLALVLAAWVLVRARTSIASPPTGSGRLVRAVST